MERRKDSEFNQASCCERIHLRGLSKSSRQLFKTFCFRWSACLSGWMAFLTTDVTDYTEFGILFEGEQKEIFCAFCVFSGSFNIYLH